jgi:hypothetical protein
MMKRFAASILVLVGVAVCQEYVLGAVVLDCGGSLISSSGYSAGISLSQPFASGWLASADFRAIVGFWHGPYAPIGIAEEATKPDVEMTNAATVVRGMLTVRGDCQPVSVGETGGCTRATLLDATGRTVLMLHEGANDVSRLAPGVYFVMTEGDRPQRVVIVR